MTTEKTAEATESSPRKSSALSLILKLLLLLIVLAVGAVGVLYAIGGSEMEFVVKQDIKAKRNDVYKLITDPEKVKKWIEGIKSIEPIGEIKGHKVGAKSKIVVESEGTTIEMIDEVTKTTLNQETELTMTSDMFEVVQHFKLDYQRDEKGVLQQDATVVTQTYKIKFKGFARVMAPFVKQAIEDQIKKNLTGLKELAEKSAEQS